MSNSYKELFQSNDNEKIFTKFLSLITEKKEKDSLKFLYELITFYIEEKSANGIKRIATFNSYTEALQFKENPKNKHDGLWTIGLHVEK